MPDACASDLTARKCVGTVSGTVYMVGIYSGSPLYYSLDTARDPGHPGAIQPYWGRNQMWNKAAEAKPSPQAPVPVMPAPEANVQQTQAVSAPVAMPQVVNAAPKTATAPNGMTTISSGLKINGEISGDSDLYIEGETQGKIRLTNARVTVGTNGCVQADIEAREIIIEGSVQGNLKAGERVQLGAQSKVQGSVLTPRFAIEDGARLRGQVEMVRTGASQASSSAESAVESSKAKVMSASSKDQ